MKQIIRIGSRKSPLALKQVDLVIAALQERHIGFADEYEVQVMAMMTSGDKFLEAKLEAVGGKGLFTKEVDEALLGGDVDITVHSAKDMPTALPEGIIWPCVLPRDQPSDYYVSYKYPNLDDLPVDAVIGTASLRRQLFMQKFRPNAEIKLIRGNVGTRLRKVEEGEFDATMLASAGLKRLGLTPPGQALDAAQFIPAPAQGVVAIHCRKGDERVQKMLASIRCHQSYTAAQIEREVMRLLDGSCRTPIAAYAIIKGDSFELNAMLGDENSGAMAVEKTSGAVADYLAICSDVASQLKAAL